MDLAGKVAIVTGASRGVGAATAVALAGAGCSVTCPARATEASLREEHGIMATRVGREHRHTPGILTENPMRLPT